MSLKNLHRIHHTLAFRLTLWYASIFTASSFVAFLFFYLLITAVIHDRIDKNLLEEVEKFSSLLSSNGMEAVRRVAVVEAQAAGERKIFFRLLSMNGQVFSSSNMSYWEDIRVSKTALKKLIQGEDHAFDTIAIQGRKHKIRMLYALIGPATVLQLGQSMEQYTRFIEAFRKIFVATMSFLVLLAALIGWFMARQALSGLEEVTRTAQYISAGTLDKRVPMKKRGDEIDQLAATFNHMLDRIQSLVKEIREMSDNIAHDLKSPITRIRGIAEVTLTTGNTEDEFEQMAASTIEDCDRLLEMINTMLMISETEAGAGRLEPEPMDMAEVAREACDLFHPMVEDKGLIMSCVTPEHCPFCGDVRLIQRMISNLVDNAIKYTPPGGNIDISVGHAEEGWIFFAIKDEGIGISERDLPHIFERFYRGDPSRSRSGIGLGLSLARAIARAHGGTIEVTSKPQEGSTFTVKLRVRA